MEQFNAQNEEISKIKQCFLKFKENVKVNKQMLYKIFTCAGFKKIGSNLIVIDYVDSELLFMT